MRQDKAKDYSKQKMETAARIREVREKLGLTQEKVAECAGMTIENYKKIEEGYNGMSMTSLRNVQKALDVSFDYLLEGRLESTEELWRKINAYNEKEKMELLLKMLFELSRVKFTEEELYSYMIADTKEGFYHTKGDNSHEDDTDS